MPCDLSTFYEIHRLSADAIPISVKRFKVFESLQIENPTKLNLYTLRV